MARRHAANSPDAGEAREFLMTRLTEQAMLERTPLSDVERRILTFSESDPEADFAALDAFNENHNTEEFETRVIQLVRRAYRFDSNRGGTEGWKEALRVLKRADFYLIGIIERKGFWSDPPKTNPSLVHIVALVLFTFLFILDRFLSPRRITGLKELSFFGLCVWFVATVAYITWQKLMDRRD